MEGSHDTSQFNKEPSMSTPNESDSMFLDVRYNDEEVVQYVLSQPIVLRQILLRYRARNPAPLSLASQQQPVYKPQARRNDLHDIVIQVSGVDECGQSTETNASGMEVSTEYLQDPLSSLDRIGRVIINKLYFTIKKWK